MHGILESYTIIINNKKLAHAEFVRSCTGVLKVCTLCVTHAMRKACIS